MLGSTKEGFFRDACGEIVSLHRVSALLFPWFKSLRFCAWGIMACQYRIWYLLDSWNRLAGGNKLNDMGKGRRIGWLSRVIWAWARARIITRRSWTGRFARCTWLLVPVFRWLCVSLIRCLPGLVGLKVKWWRKLFFPSKTNIKNQLLFQFKT